MKMDYKSIIISIIVISQLCTFISGKVIKSSSNVVKKRGTEEEVKDPFIIEASIYVGTNNNNTPCSSTKNKPARKDSHCSGGGGGAETHKELHCKYKHNENTGNICEEPSIGVPCVVSNRTYNHGETFNLDCRTQCTCQNGTYGCSSLCPQEHISPRECQHPQLVDINGQCCREWMCDSRTAEQPPSCQPSFTKWSTCSSICGSGFSSRKSNLNAQCLPTTETRICQIRRCEDTDNYVDNYRKYHHLRKGHECKATHRLSEPVFLRFGPCRSRKRFRPKYCGLCPIPATICEPTLSTTVKVDFICEGPTSLETTSELLFEYLEPDADLWADEFPPSYDSDDFRLVSILVQWILKCHCIPQNLLDTDEANMLNMNNNSSSKIVLHRVHRN